MSHSLALPCSALVLDSAMSGDSSGHECMWLELCARPFGACLGRDMAWHGGHPGYRAPESGKAPEGWQPHTPHPLAQGCYLASVT